jgi:ketosteroid isomerase-like protein
MQADRVVRHFFERMQARDWNDAKALLAHDIRIEYTASRERFDGDNFMAMNEVYPDGWELTVKEVLAVGDRVAAQVVVRHGDDTFWCAGFYTVVGSRITEGVEHWVTEGSEPAPDWRRVFTTNLTAATNLTTTS